VIAFRHADPRLPFLWETEEQPAGRWHAAGEGPVQYLASTPDGAWAEFLRHEEIRTPAELATVRRNLWAIDLPKGRHHEPALAPRVATGGLETYPACQHQARALRRRGAKRLHVPSAALREGSAPGWRVDGILRPGPKRREVVFVLFGRRPDLVGWHAVAAARPPADVLARVHHFRAVR